MKYIIAIIYFQIFCACGQHEKDKELKTGSEPILNRVNSSQIKDTIDVFNKQTRHIQIATVYNENDSIINSYSTAFTVEGNGVPFEYVYMNSKATEIAVSPNDLFQLLNDTLAAYDYDTCKLIAIDTLKVDEKLFQIKKYKFLDKEFGDYILFNNELGILIHENKFQRTEFGTKINSHLKNNH